MMWLFANAVLRLALTIVLTLELARFNDMLNKAERVGIGFMGAASFLTIPVILADQSAHRTPFWGWASTLFSLGALIYFTGRITRLIRHKARNELMKRQAKAHMLNKAKLSK